MTESELQYLAEQLRKPSGADGIKIARNLSEGNRVIYSNTLASLRVGAGERILEIGMADGFFVDDILALAPELQYHGVDFSEIMVSEARRINATRPAGHQANFVLGDVADLPFDDDQFDAALTINTIYFWENPESALNNIRRVLKPNGQLVVSVRPKRVMQHYPFVKFGFELFTAENLVASLTGAGFHVTDVNDYDEAPRMIDGSELEIASLVVRGVKSEA